MLPEIKDFLWSALFLTISASYFGHPLSILDPPPAA
jgi:hypothetical protein